MAGSPLTTAASRVFLIEGRARADHVPSYESCMRLLGVTQGFGDVERVECPDPTEYGKFIEVGQIRGATERATASLEGRYMMNLKSELLRLAAKGCAIDVQLHMGECTDPADFNTFKKALVLEDAFLTNFATGDLGALGSGDDASVEETGDVSAKLVYEVLPLGFGVKAGSLVTNEVIDIVICDNVSCGDCETESDGCQKIYALTLSAGGSPGTPADIVFSVDGGLTWYAHDVDTLGAAEDPNELDCVGVYLVVVSNDSGSLHYALKSEFDGTTDPAFTEIATGIVAGGEPNAIHSVGNFAFVVGDNGYIYSTLDVTSGVTLVDAGTLTGEDLISVHALSSEFAVAGGNNGVVLFTENGTTWATTTTEPFGVGINVNTVFVKSEQEWWVGGSNGRLYYTFDKGVTWTERTFPGSGTGVVYHIEFATDSIAYLAHANATPLGRILRSYDGGHSWQVMPEGTGTLAANDRINALATCGDPNLVAGGGLADDGADGIIVLGEA